MKKYVKLDVKRMALMFFLSITIHFLSLSVLFFSGKIADKIFLQSRLDHLFFILLIIFVITVFIKYLKYMYDLIYKKVYIKVRYYFLSDILQSFLHKDFLIVEKYNKVELSNQLEVLLK